MEFAWCEFKEGRAEGNTFAKSMHRLKLFPQASGGNVKFNWGSPHGTWSYDAGHKLMFIEFEGCQDKDEPDRRHALRDRGNGNFQLIPYDDDIYQASGIWTDSSVPHKNFNNWIVMQRIEFPDAD